MAEKSNIKLGKTGEQKAVCYLVRAGYWVIERNWRTREGEIDIIAYDGDRQELVFAEVKTRTNDRFGSPEESIGPAKKLRLFKVISTYIDQNSYPGDYRCDLIIVRADADYALEHLKNVSLE